MPSVRRVNWAKFRVSMVGLVATLILMVLVYLLTGGELLQPKATVFMYVPDATGVAPGAPVRVDGIGVGKVLGVKLTPSRDQSRAIQVSMTITREHLASIPVDSFAQLSTDNLIGDKFVDVTSGKDPNHIQPNGEIRFKFQPDLMKTLDLTEFEKQLREVDATLADIERGQGLVGQFVMGEQVYDSLLKKLLEFQKEVRNISATNTSMGQALYSDEMYKQIRQPAVDLDRTLAQIQSGQGQAGQLFRGNELYEQWRAVATNLRRTLQDIRSSDLIHSDTQYEEWNRLVGTMIHSVDQMNADPLLNRTDAYENLNGVARELRDSVKDFREHPSKYLRLKVF
ncbi:MAG TPA: MlaD family protein [Bryobacteraceae bacterium]|nr:MlaD family protein [Bryobacteraceae bacterium]